MTVQALTMHCMCTVAPQRTGVKKTKQKKWKKKMQNSPFHIDLVAESERIDEVRTNVRGPTAVPPLCSPG